VRGVHCLRALLAAGEPVAGVLGHGGAEPGEAAGIAREAGLPYLAPRDPNVDAVLEWTRELGCSLAVMSGYARILRGRFISGFPRGVINLHGGPLPQYRGGSPLNWQILRGETSIGISLLFTETGIDTGPLLAEDRFEIGPDETIDSTVERSLPAFEKLLLGVLEGLRSGSLRPRPQDAAGARYFAKRLPQDGWIDWHRMSAKQVHDLVRALAGSYPGAFSFWRGDKLVLETTHLLDETIIGPPGRVLARRKRGVEVACSDRALLVGAARDDTGAVVRAGEVLPPRDSSFDAAAPADSG
jgi:methionyl-tRNA formyltransferase